MADQENKTVKKTLRLKTAKTQDDAPTQDADLQQGGHAPVIATMGLTPRASSGDSSTGAAIVAVIATLVFAAIVILELMEWQVYASPGLFPQ